MYQYECKHLVYSGEEQKISGEFGTFTISYVELLDENTIEFVHRHTNDYEIYYVYKGKMTMSIGDVICHAEEDDFFLVKPNTFHEVIYTPWEPHKYLVMIFNPDYFQAENMEFGNELSKKISTRLFLRGHDRSGCNGIIDSMIEESCRKEVGYRNMLLLQNQMFIQKVCRDLLPKEISQEPKPRTTNLPLLITKYLHDHYMEAELSLDDIARDLCISKRHASRLFLEFFGTTLSRTLREYRVSYAISYLLTTNYSNAQIAEAVGSNPTTLSKMFQVKTGMTMSQYRNNIRKKRMQKTVGQS